MSSQTFVFTGLTIVYSVLRVGSALLFSWWLFRIWRCQRTSVYLWLLVGIGVIPLLQAVSQQPLIAFVGQIVQMLDWRTDAIPILITTHSILFLVGEYLFILVALAKLAGELSISQSDSIAGEKSDGL